MAAYGISKGYDRNIINFINLLQKIDESSSHQSAVNEVFAKVQNIFQDLIYPPDINRNILLTQTPIARIKKSIADLGLSKTENKLALYISPSYKKFWVSGPGCWEPAFMIPALIGLPLLNGVRSGMDDCESIQGYGMKDYGKSSLNYQLSLTDICMKAKKLGFKKVYEITEIKNQIHNCELISKVN